MTDQFQIAVGWALGLGSIGSAIAVGVAKARHHGIAIGIASATTTLVGLLIMGMAVAHLVGVLWTAAGRGYFYYDFRFAALLLVGVLIVVAGALCVAGVRGLVRGQGISTDRAVSGTLLLLLVSAPLAPVQPDLAGGLTVFAIVNLVILIVVRLRTQAIGRLAT
jgi:hypothetical protein